MKIDMVSIDKITIYKYIYGIEGNASYASVLNNAVTPYRISELFPNIFQSLAIKVTRTKRKGLHTFLKNSSVFKVFFVSMRRVP